MTAERAQLAALAAQSAAQREAWFGVPMSYEGCNTYTASSAAFKSSRQLEESGFERKHDAIIRVNRTNPVNAGFQPCLGKLIVVDGQTFKIEEILAPRLNPEWRIGLDAANVAAQ
jgi:hypothetical protein